MESWVGTYVGVYSYAQVRMMVDQTREGMKSIWIFDILKEKQAGFPDGLHVE